MESDSSRVIIQHGHFFFSLILSFIIITVKLYFYLFIYLLLLFFSRDMTLAQHQGPKYLTYHSRDDNNNTQ